MIIVTGANGFIGSAVVWELNQLGLTDIVVVDSVALASRPLPLHKRQYQTFLDEHQLWDFLQLPSTQKNTSWVIHMGANSSTTESNWEHLYMNNTMYTQRLFEWCAQHKKKIIYASSAATYGAGELGYSDSLDSEQLQPLNLYGKSKVLFDRWAERQQTFPAGWYGLKFFNVYGPNEYHKGAMASLVFKAFHQVRQNGSLRLFKSYLSQYRDGEQMRDFVYVKDVTRWIAELMHKQPASGIYNMGFGQANTWLDLARPLFQAMHQPQKIEFIEMPENIRSQYQYFTQAEMHKWQAAGLSHPQWPVAAGVKDYVQNYLQQDDSFL